MMIMSAQRFNGEGQIDGVDEWWGIQIERFQRRQGGSLEFECLALVSCCCWVQKRVITFWRMVVAVVDDVVVSSSH